jgi:hypothetical protein
MSAITPFQGVPSGQHAPFAVVTDDDHSAWIIIAAAMGISFMLVALVARILIRSYINLGWALDDTLLVVTTVSRISQSTSACFLTYPFKGIAFIQSSLVLGAASSGLGCSVDLVPPSKRNSAQEVSPNPKASWRVSLTALQTYYTSNIFYLITIDLSKLCSLLFIRRLQAPGSTSRKYTTILVAAVPVSTIAFILSTSIQCNLMQPWVIVHNHCSGWVSTLRMCGQYGDR